MDNLPNRKPETCPFCGRDTERVESFVAPVLQHRGLTMPLQMWKCIADGPSDLDRFPHTFFVHDEDVPR